MKPPLPLPPVDPPDTPSMARARLAGAVLQGLILGTGLFLALAKMTALTSGARVFNYQAF